MQAFSKGKLIKAERELFALGTLNVVGGFFRCFPSNTSLFRTETSSNTKSSHFVRAPRTRASVATGRYLTCAFEQAGLGAAILVTAAIFTSVRPVVTGTFSTGANAGTTLTTLRWYSCSSKSFNRFHERPWLLS